MINMFQQGGAAMPPYVDYQPVMVNPATASTAPGTTSNKGSDLTDKDLLKMLEKLDGLPSDMAELTNALQNFYIDQQYSILPNTTSIASRYLSVLNQMKVANFNKSVYDDALKTVSANGGINELAVTERGQLICINKNRDFKLLRPEELASNSDYTPLSNSELLYYRAHDTSLANQNELLKTVKSGVGIESIQKMIDGFISNLGTNTVQTSGYAQKKEGQVISGLNILNIAAQQGLFSGDEMSIDGLYKNKILNTTQANQIELAINYIYSVLPENAKTVLKCKTAGKTDQETRNLLLSLLYSKNSSTSQFDTILQKNSNGSKDGNSGKGQEINRAIAFQTDLGPSATLKFNAGTTDTLRVQGNLMSNVTKEDGLLGVTTLDKIAAKSSLSGLFDFSHVTVGNKTISMTGLSNVIADANQIYKAYLPIDLAKAESGIITPDLLKLADIEKVREQIRETGAESPEEINQIYQEFGLENYLKPDGSINEAIYKPFGVMNATALSDAFPEGTEFNSKLFREITDPNEINNAWSIIKGADTKEKFDAEGWYDTIDIIGFGSYQSMVDSLVFLPMLSTNPSLGAVSGGGDITVEDLHQYNADHQRREIQDTFEAQGQLIL